MLDYYDDTIFSFTGNALFQFFFSLVPFLWLHIMEFTWTKNCQIIFRVCRSFWRVLCLVSFEKERISQQLWSLWAQGRSQFVRQRLTLQYSQMKKPPEVFVKGMFLNWSQKKNIHIGCFLYKELQNCLVPHCFPLVTAPMQGKSVSQDPSYSTLASY